MADGGDFIDRGDLDAALRFVYARENQTSQRADRVEALLLSVAKALVDGGVIDREALDAALAAPPPTREGAAPPIAVELALPSDKYAVQSPADLDCATLLPICQARCCRLAVELSPQDLEEGELRWSYAHPFHLEQKDGACVHQAATRMCGVYERRPAACRGYDCRGDKRIWLDFEKRIPAPLSATAARSRLTATETETE